LAEQPHWFCDTNAALQAKTKHFPSSWCFIFGAVQQGIKRSGVLIKKENLGGQTFSGPAQADTAVVSFSPAKTG
jgi:hypothetical protein